MLKKINERYVSYTDNEYTYVVDLNSNWISLLFGYGEIYFKKTGFIVKEKQFTTNIDEQISTYQLQNKQKIVWLNWTSTGIVILFGVFLRTVFGESAISNIYLRFCMIFPITIGLIVASLYLSDRNKKHFLKSYTIMKKINMKIDYGNRNQLQKLKGVIILNLCLLIIFIPGIVFIISGHIQAYIVYVMLHSGIGLFRQKIRVPTAENSNGMYDIKLIIVD
ncbi:MAG: hypothetical protein ACRCV7_01845 [Culicoidibacterales bacterium]